jgi:two-component system cell cycle response regulator DivK
MTTRTSCRNGSGTLLSDAVLVPPTSEPDGDVQLPNELILVIEDNDHSRKLVRDILKFRGYQIIEAETGEDGVRLAQERLPSVVLMDIRLPGIDGIEALRQLRAEAGTRAIPVLAMTASVMTEHRQKIMDAGFDAFQSKPIAVKEFIAAVEELIVKRRG